MRVWVCGSWGVGLGSLSVYTQAGGCVGGLGSPDDTGLTIQGLGPLLLSETPVVNRSQISNLQDSCEHPKPYKP